MKQEVITMPHLVCYFTVDREPPQKNFPDDSINMKQISWACSDSHDDVNWEWVHRHYMEWEPFHLFRGSAAAIPDMAAQYIHEV